MWKRLKIICKESDIYIHSATYEPLGLVILEAMAAGLPVISLRWKRESRFNRRR